MRLEIVREDLLKPLQWVVGAVERRQAMPILSHLLLETTPNGTIDFTTSDLEVEMHACLSTGGLEAGSVTVPARKLLDICRALPEGVKVNLVKTEGRSVLTAGSSRFTLASRDPNEFPRLEDTPNSQMLPVDQTILSGIIHRTSFAMAQQDVRYFLNGLYLELHEGKLRAVATDGHRLALSDSPEPVASEANWSVIVPRKAVNELERLLSQTEDRVEFYLGETHARFSVGQFEMTTKLVDGRFPEYERVIPVESTKRLLVDRGPMRESLSRVAILANEKFRGVRLEADEGRVRLVAHNPDHEEAEETIPARYDGERITIAFNAGYLLDALSALEHETVEFGMTDGNSSILITAPGDSVSRYVVMPMRL